MVCARIANTARSSGWIPVQTPFGRFQVESWPVPLDRGPRVPYYLVMPAALTTPTAISPVQTLTQLVKRAQANRGMLRLASASTGFQLEIECDGTTLLVVLCMWDNGDEAIYDGPLTDANMGQIARAIEAYDVIVSDESWNDLAQ